MHFLTALAISMLSFSTTIVAIDYPNIADLVSKEREYVGPDVEVFGRAVATLNVIGWGWANTGSP